MARQRLGLKKTLRLRQQTGLPVVRVLVRGGTNHSRDLLLSTGHIVMLSRDGSMELDRVCTWNVPPLLTYTPS
jgi:hypothetical protein